MLSWLSSRCPIDTSDQAWTETRFRWLVSRLGFDRITAIRMIPPDDEALSALVREPSRDLRPLCDWISRAMGISTDDVALEVCADSQMPRALGYYDATRRVTIRIRESQLGEPLGLIATMAHEIAHHVLLGGGLLTADEHDHEFVTDLTAVVLGFGIFMANAVVQESYVSDGRSYSWRMQGRGYLRATTLGYALALWAHVRREEKPAWASWLRLDAAESLRRGLKYLRRGTDSLVNAGAIRGAKSPRPDHETRSELRHTSAHRRLAALWEVGAWTDTSKERVRAEIETLVSDRDAAVRRASFELLGCIARPSTEFEQRIVDGVDDRDLMVRSAAANLAARWKLAPSRVVATVMPMIESPDRQEIAVATQTLFAYGPLAEPATIMLFDALVRAILRCDEWLTDELVKTIQAIVANPVETARRLFETRSHDRFLAVKAALLGRGLSGQAGPSGD